MTSSASVVQPILDGSPSVLARYVAHGMEVECLFRERIRQGFLSIDRLTMRQRTLDGSWSPPFKRELLERGQAVAVVLHDPRLDHLLFVRQFRPGAMLQDSPFVLELVAGMIDTADDGTPENPEISARRESLEEANVQLGTMTRIGSFLMSAGGSNETTTLYYATTDLSQPDAWGGAPDEHEVLKIETMRVDDALEGLEQGLFNTASTCLGLYWLKAQRAMGHCGPLKA